MTDQQVIVRNIHESLNNDRLKVGVEVNSRGVNYSVDYRGADEDDVIKTTARVLRRLREEIEGE